VFFSIDRFEGETAVLIGEDRRPLEVPVSLLPQGAKPGEMLFYGKDGFSPAPEKTAERRGRMAAILEKLLKQGDKET
jgi:hypothetical protein